MMDVQRFSKFKHVTWKIEKNSFEKEIYNKKLITKKIYLQYKCLQTFLLKDTEKLKNITKSLSLKLFIDDKSICV